MKFADRLSAAVKRTRSVTCVGLDPRLDQLPQAIRQSVLSASDLQSTADAFEVFCCGVIDVVKELVPVVKPQAAFFEQLGPAGMLALGRVVRHASAAGLIVIMDAKRNDIGSTATGYAQAYLGAGHLSPWGSDSLTVSPYLGRDSLEPFADVCDQREAGIFVLVKTSNPGGGLFQDRESDGETVYAAVAGLVAELNFGRIGESNYGPIGAVVGATYPEQLVQLRSSMPHSWILVPGYGAQGGSASDVQGAFDERGLGGIVNSSRNIIFAHQRAEFRQSHGDARWQQAVEQATRMMNDELNVVR